MASSSTQQAPPQRRPNPLRVFCAACSHTEFVHSDQVTRRCLYAECDCSGFRTGAAA